ncbi:Nn.00g093470.m01.CDS01 [Neocucurbitaria sp. VM-36]
MPLQKTPPQGTQAPDAQSVKRRQLQERRRTLQTISELSVTDGAQPEFSSFIKTEKSARVSFASGPIAKKKNPNLSKRRSLPQYCASPACLQVQAPTERQPMHASASRRSQSSQTSWATDTRRYEEGWNARRERARAQHEQAVAQTRDQRQVSGHRLRIGSQTSLPSTTPLPSSQSSQDYLRSYASHHQLLRNSRSISGFPPTMARRSSFGASTSTGHSSQRDFDTESSERASTDSSSYHSVHESAVRRSRSGSSTQSFTLQAGPPMPNPFASPVQRYYLNPAQSHKGVSQGQLSTPMPRRPVPTNRSMSLPIIRVQDVSGTRHDGRQSASRLSMKSSQQKQYIDIQTARLETLAALTASRHDPYMAKRASPPMTKSTHLQHTSAFSPPNRNSYRHSTSRSRSRSSLQPPPPAYQTSNTANIIYAQNPDKQGLLPPPDIDFEKRVVPKRESLTQWKAEREEARAEFDGMRRENTKERVRRANELEQEKEKELLMMGKGTVVVEEEEGKEVGCFSSLFAMFPWRKA